MLEMWSNFAKTGDAFNIEYSVLDIEQNTTRHKIQLKHKSKREYYADDDQSTKGGPPYIQLLNLLYQTLHESCPHLKKIVDPESQMYLSKKNTERKEDVEE